MSQWDCHAEEHAPRGTRSTLSAGLGTCLPSGFDVDLQDRLAPAKRRCGALKGPPPTAEPVETNLYAFYHKVNKVGWVDGG